MKVCIFWGRDVFQKPWDALLNAFDVSRDDLYVVVLPEHDSKQPEMSKMTGACNFMESAENLPPGELVVATPKIANNLPGENCLHCFEHPKDAIYVFGADNISLAPWMFGSREINYTLYVPVAEQTKDLHSHTAAAMVLYDRRYKAWAAAR